MADHHFISYSPPEAQEFAFQLTDALTAGPPSLPAWLDKRKIHPGQDWDEQLAEAIRTCASLVFVMTPDSVGNRSVCKAEWVRALAYKKPIVPLKLHPDAMLPFRISSRQHIDFTGPFEPALARLRQHLQWLASPAGALQALDERLEDAHRDERRAQDPAEVARIAADITELERQIVAQRQAIEHPQAVAARVEASIAVGLERERQPARPVGGITHSKFVNPPPAAAPTHFQDRHVETALIGRLLGDKAIRLITVVGRAGIGKTAMVCRLLKALEQGQLPDDGGPLPVDGIVYLSAVGSRRLDVPTLYADLARLLPDDRVTALETLAKDPLVTTEDQFRALLAEFPAGRTVLLLDNFEDRLDATTLEVQDRELDGALRTVLGAPHHGVKVVLTTRVAPRALGLIEPGRQRRLDLDEGLGSPYAENILRALDADGKLGLRDAPAALLDEARERTRGYPRALEALVAILSADRGTTLREVLDDPALRLPEQVVEVLVGEAFSRLDPIAQQVLQALAIYGRPVAAVAVDYLLQPYLASVNSSPVLGRPVGWQFTRREAGRYYLHPVDRTYALSRIPAGSPEDRDTAATSFTQYALLHGAAEYFRHARRPREDWKQLEDLAPQLAELDLPCAGEDYDAAATVLSEIDVDYLLLWGHVPLMAELHERLAGKLSDRELEARAKHNQGLAYNALDRQQAAVVCFEQALAIYREIGDRGGEGAALTNLGSCYQDLGQVARALDYFEQALAISQEIGNRLYEGIVLLNLAELASSAGRTMAAVEHVQAGLQLAQQLGNTWLDSLAHATAAETSFLAGDLPTARAAATRGCQDAVPELHHRLLALLGIIALRQDDQVVAHQAFVDTVIRADAWLSTATEDYKALDAKGMALAGLMLCGQDRQTDAITSFQAARALNSSVGVVGVVLRRLNALAPADPTGVLERVRSTAAGTAL